MADEHILIAWRQHPGAPSDTAFSSKLACVDMTAVDGEDAVEFAVTHWQDNLAEMHGGTVVLAPWGMGTPIPGHCYDSDSPEVANVIEIAEGPADDQVVMVIMETLSQILAELKSIREKR